MERAIAAELTTLHKQDFPEILKRMAYNNMERNMPFLVHSLAFNRRVLVRPEEDAFIWVCRDSIATLVQAPNDAGEESEERFYLALADVKAIEVNNSPRGHEGMLVRREFWLLEL